MLSDVSLILIMQAIFNSWIKSRTLNQYTIWLWKEGAVQYLPCSNSSSVTELCLYSRVWELHRYILVFKTDFPTILTQHTQNNSWNPKPENFIVILTIRKCRSLSWSSDFVSVPPVFSYILVCWYNVFFPQHP